MQCRTNPITAAAGHIPSLLLFSFLPRHLSLLSNPLPLRTSSHPRTAAAVLCFALQYGAGLCRRLACHIAPAHNPGQTMLRNPAPPRNFAYHSRCVAIPVQPGPVITLCSADHCRSLCQANLCPSWPFVAFARYRLSQRYFAPALLFRSRLRLATAQQNRAKPPLIVS